MERIDRSEGDQFSNIGKEYSHSCFSAALFYFMQICSRHVQHEGDYNCANFKDQGLRRIPKDWSGRWQESPTVVRGAQSLWQNPSETHLETPKTPLKGTSPYVHVNCPCLKWWIYKIWIHFWRRKKILQYFDLANNFVSTVWIIN